MQLQTLHDKLANIERLFPASKILKRNTTDTEQIAKYYKKNRLAYRLFNSHEGFVHMGISQGDDFSVSDFYKQAELVDNVIKALGADDVLELAVGKAATTKYLASRHPKVHFYGIDLKGGQFKVKQQLSNINFIYGDYHDLSAYADSSMGVVYVIEALCHARDKSKVIAEAYRVLRKGGAFIIIDGYFTQNSRSSAEERTASQLVASSMMVTDKDQTYRYFTTALAKCGFTIKDSIDYSQNILPSLYRLEAKAKKLIDNPRLGKIIKSVTSDMMTTNAVAGYLMPICVENGLFEYRYTLAIKK